MGTKHTPTPLAVASDGVTIGFLDDMIQGTMGRSVMPGKVVATTTTPGMASAFCDDVNTCAELRAAGIDDPADAIAKARKALQVAIDRCAAKGDEAPFAEALRALGG